MSDSTPLPRLPPRLEESNKGDFGRALLIGGSRGMAGSISLSGMATLRSGAGLVQLAVPAAIQSTVAGFEPSYMTVTLPEDSDGRIAGTAQAALTEHIKPVTAIACGPGLGRSGELTDMVVWLYQHCSQPMVFDADALNALASRPDTLTHAGGPRVLTPHPGEFGRLVPGSKGTDRSAMEQAASESAANWQAVVVLKGHHTFITDGRQHRRNTTGNPGMATGGTGDVLTGIITALLCQGLSAYDAACLGVHLHGLAGDLAAKELGQPSLIASDLILFLHAAFKSVESEGSAKSALGFHINPR
jgi:ADP-dependent NAD(P)H-hydrate dehydratase